MAAILGIFITMGAMAKLFQVEELLSNFAKGGIEGWAVIIGAGELITLILFLIPATMRLGAMLFAAYFGGAIMFHMSHPLESEQGFVGATIYFTLILAISWIRGMELVKIGKKA